MKKIIVSLLAGAALTIASTVSAATLCSAPGTQPDGLDVTDVTFNGTNATDCNGVFTGQATASTLGFDGFTAVASADAGGSGTGSFGGENFTLSVTTGSNGSLGTWSLAWDGVTGPITIDLVAVVQTATTFASYFFDNLVLSVSPGSGNGDWVINYLVNENLPLLSSFSLYARDFRSTTVTPPPSTDVVEPGTLALFALAILALGFAWRTSARKRR